MADRSPYIVHKSNPSPIRAVEKPWTDEWKALLRIALLKIKNIKNISSVIVSRVFISIALHFLHSSQPRNVIRALLFKLVKICITYFVAALTTGLYFLFSDLKPIEVANITRSPGRETPTPEGSNPINIVRVT